jgi:Putative lumazine-binding
MTDTASRDDSREAILATVLDYYEGWFDGDAARMARALHPDLIKRSLDHEEGIEIETITALEMIDGAKRGLGRLSDPAARRIDICIDHVHVSIAAAHATGPVYVDYLQLVRADGRWRILNALWARA